MEAWSREDVAGMGSNPIRSLIFPKKVPILNRVLCVLGSNPNAPKSLEYSLMVEQEFLYFRE